MKVQVDPVKLQELQDAVDEFKEKSGAIIDTVARVRVALSEMEHAFTVTREDPDAEA